MKIKDLMDMTLGDLLDTYGLLYNLECGYYYGICSYDLCDRMFEEYDMDTYKEAVVVDPLIVMEVFLVLITVGTEVIEGVLQIASESLYI